MTPSEVISRLEGVKRSGDGKWTARCPAHDDSRASLSVAAAGGKTLLNCHAGCKTDDVVQGMGLTMADIQGDDDSPKQEQAIEYDYTAADGVLLFQAVRFPGKSFRQRRPDGQGGWLWSVKGIEQVPYRLPELTKAKSVFVVEGEKDADRLRSLGLVATTNAGGADKWPAELSQHFAGKRVAIIPDNDAPGEKHAQLVAKSLDGIAEAIAIVRLPGLREKEDVSDWLDAGNSKDRLLSLTKAAFRSPMAFMAFADRAEGGRELRSQDGKQAMPFGVGFFDDFLRGILPTDLILLGAKTGAGKTELASILALHAAEAGRRVYMFALEAEPGEIEWRAEYRELSQKLWAMQHPIAAEYTYKAFRLGLYADEVAPYVDEVERTVRERYRTLKTYYRGAEDFGVSDLVRQCERVRDDADLIVVDHLHYLDAADSEAKSLSDAAKALRETALVARVPVVAVAHLRKSDRKMPRIVPDEEDFHGTSNLTKIATRVLVLAPCRDLPPDRPYFAPTYLAVPKERLGGAGRWVAVVNFDLRTNSYQSEYTLGRMNPAGDTWEELSPRDVPTWAKTATNRRACAAA